jgi:hypothetical protein
MQLQRGLAAQRGWERKSLHSVQRSSSSARRLLKPAMVFTGIVQGMAEVRVRVCVCVRLARACPVVYRAAQFILTNRW